MPRYLIRLMVTFILVVTVVVTVRRMVVPSSFGLLGHYRAAALGDIAAQQPRYAGRLACEACHQDIVKIKMKGSHAGLSCEVCHGPSEAHVRNPHSASAAPFTDLDRNFCLHCHDQSISRPAGFPMVDGLTHNPKEDCRTCHAPHTPNLSS